MFSCRPAAYLAVMLTTGVVVSVTNGTGVPRGAGAVAGAPADPDVQFSLVPVEPENGSSYPPGTVIEANVITLSEPHPVWLNVTLKNWGSCPQCDALVKSWQGKIDSSGYSSGVGADLGPKVDIPCSDHADCVTQLGPGAECDLPSGEFCKALWQDDARSDWIFEQIRPGPPYYGDGWAASCSDATLDYSWGAAALGQCAPDDGMERYGGAMVVDVPPDARGTYTIGFLRGVPGNEMTFIWGCQTPSEMPPPMILVPAVIRIPTGACCDQGPGSGGTCTDEVFLAECLDPQQIWTEGATCAEVDCDEATGACCDSRAWPAPGEWGCTDDVLQSACQCETCTWYKGETCADAGCYPELVAIPAVTNWGLLVMTMLLLIAAKVRCGRRAENPHATARGAVVGSDDTES